MRVLVCFNILYSPSKSLLQRHWFEFCGENTMTLLFTQIHKLCSANIGQVNERNIEWVSIFLPFSSCSWVVGSTSVPWESVGEETGSWLLQLDVAGIPSLAIQCWWIFSPVRAPQVLEQNFPEIYPSHIFNDFKDCVKSLEKMMHFFKGETEIVQVKSCLK